MNEKKMPPPFLLKQRRTLYINGERRIYQTIDYFTYYLTSHNKNE